MKQHFHHYSYIKIVEAEIGVHIFPTTLRKIDVKNSSRREYFEENALNSFTNCKCCCEVKVENVLIF